VCDQAQTTGSSSLHKCFLMTIWSSTPIHIFKLFQKATISMLLNSATAKSVSIKLLLQEVQRQVEAVSNSEVAGESSWANTAQVDWQ